MALGKSAVIIDSSLYTPEEVERQRVRQAAALGQPAVDSTGAVADAGQVRAGSQAFDDLTDLQNDEFVFVY